MLTPYDNEIEGLQTRLDKGIFYSDKSKKLFVEKLQVRNLQREGYIKAKQEDLEIIDKTLDKAEFEVKVHVENFGKGNNRDMDSRDKLTLLSLPVSIKKKLKSLISQDTKPSTSSICDNSADVGNANRLRVDKTLDVLRDFAEKIKEDLIIRVNKYGLDFCHQLFIKHIDKLLEEFTIHGGIAT
jgi:hypothetical protein